MAKTPHYDLGHGFTARRINHALTCPFRTETSGICGLIVSHTHDDGTLCDGFIPWCRHCAGQHMGLWRFVSFDPLTVAPVVHVRACDSYGEITGGKWVPR